METRLPETLPYQLATLTGVPRLLPTAADESAVDCLPHIAWPHWSAAADRRTGCRTTESRVGTLSFRGGSHPWPTAGGLLTHMREADAPEVVGISKVEHRAKAAASGVLRKAVADSHVPAQQCAGCPP